MEVEFHTYILKPFHDGDEVSEQEVPVLVEFTITEDKLDLSISDITDDKGNSYLNLIDEQEYRRIVEEAFDRVRDEDDTKWDAGWGKN